MPIFMLERGQVYRGRAPRNANGFVNDRQIMWLNDCFVQYDSPSVAFGRHFPKVTVQAFLEWAGERVTLEVGQWETFQEYQRKKREAKQREGT